MARTTKVTTKQPKPKSAPVKTQKVKSSGINETIRNKRKLINYGLIALLLVIGLLALKELLLVATVNGRPIWRFQVVSQLEKQNGSAVLEDLIVRNLIQAEAAKNNIVVDEAEIDSRIAELTQSFGGDEAILEQQLAQANLTMEDLRSNYRLELILQKLIPQTEVSDEEAIKYFEENKEIFGDDADYETLKDSIKTQMQQESYSQTLQKYVSDLREKSAVKTYIEY